MHEERVINESKFPKLQRFFNIENTSWLVFAAIIVVGIVIRLVMINFTSSDIFVWKETAQLFLQDENPYETTLTSFQNESMKNFYAYFPLWMYLSSLILLIFPESWFFIVIKLLLLVIDLLVVVTLYFILKDKTKNSWRLKLPIAIWFVTPFVFMTGAMHGKFDSLMLLFILLACLFHEKENFLLESLFLSFAILTKTIALIIVPFFFIQSIKQRNFGKILVKVGILLFPLLLFSIPFLHTPITYYQGVLGVHITRGHDLAPLFALLSLPFSSARADTIIRICLTVVIIISWLTTIVLAFLKELDVYTCCLLAFAFFNLFYWVFLIQYAVWIYTFYVVVTTKINMKKWVLPLSTTTIVVLSSLLMFFMGLFVMHGA